MNAGPGQERPGTEKPTLLMKILCKSNDFERHGASGAAGDEKANGFLTKFFEKVTVLSARPGRERPGMKISTLFNENPLKKQRI